MENASKALLIAGAILIVILLIAVGMIVYNNSKSTIDAGVAQMDSTEIQMFNAQFTEYEGKQSGTNVKALINAVSANNATNAGNASKLVNVVVNKDVLSGSNRAYNANSSSTVGSIAQYVVTTKTYTVTMTRNSQGLVSSITIQ